MNIYFLSCAGLVFLVLCAILFMSLAKAAKTGDKQLHEEFPEGGYLSN